MSVSREVISRCLSLIPLIRENQGITLDELARKARLPKEQIANELGSVLLMCGVPPYFPHDYIGFTIENGRVSIRFADQFERPMSLSALEALALKLAVESVAGPGGKRPPAVDRLLEKVEAGMAPEQREQFRILARRVAVRPSEDTPDGLTAKAAMGIAERRALALDYRDQGSDSVRRVSVFPYGLVTRDGHWFLLARPTESAQEEAVPYRLDRVQSLDLLDLRFEIPSNFRLDAFSRGPLGDGPQGRSVARVRFQGASARWVRETADPTAVEEVADDEVIWRLPFKNPESLSRFILGFGAEARVLEPAELARAAREDVKRVLEAHSDR